MQKNKEVSVKAAAVLKMNDRGQFTSPADGLYPHQWLWDSCFIAIGLRHIDVTRAQTELKSLIRGQWSNGMLPHMIFDSSVKFAHDRNIWRSELSLHAPLDISTTGITQPPVLAEAVVQIGKKLKAAERRSWYKTMLPSLIAYHQWMYEERDPEHIGLVVQIHPYETGLDSTPPWVDQLYRYHYPWWAKILKQTGLIGIAQLVRRDTRHVPADQRMDNLDALLYYMVIRKIRAKRYDIKAILKRNPYAIQDASFNAIFIRANECLQEIAETVKQELPENLQANIQKSRASFERLWDPTRGQYFSRNITSGRLIKEPSIATLMPLYAGHITQERAQQLVRMLHDQKVFGTNYPVASVPMYSRYFNEVRYWQGPTWVNTNWMIIQGLERYGFTKEADIIRLKTLELVDTKGFYEYFSPLTGEPAGAPNFSWTAALALDLDQK